MAARVAEIRRKRNIRATFRKIGRKVMLNRLWMAEAPSEQKMTFNATRNISMLVRTQRQIWSLSVQDKWLIRKDHKLRTIEERKRLLKLITGLSCFSEIPPKLRARLVPVLNFIVLPPGRMLIREGDPPNMVYFLLTGEIDASKKVHDKKSNTTINTVQFVCVPGDCIGDVEIMEDSPRNQTFTSTTVAELLVLDYDDFDYILRPYMQEQWMNKKRVLQMLTYFDFMTQEQIVEACKISALRQFNPLETIYHKDEGQFSYVNFVISGECMILQCLKMRVYNKEGKPVWELIDLPRGTEYSLLEELTTKDLKSKLNKEELADFQSLYEFQVSSSDDGQNRRYSEHMTTEQFLAKACGIKDPGVESETSMQESETSKEISSTPTISGEEMDEDVESGTFTTETSSIESLQSNVRFERFRDHKNDAKETTHNGSVHSLRSSQNSVKSKQSLKHVKSKQQSFMNSKSKQSIKSGMGPTKSAKSKSTFSYKDSSFTLNKLGEAISKTSLRSVSFGPKKSEPRPPKIVNHFIDVGTITSGGIIGLGEKIEHRVYMARTAVQCLLVPRFWLLQKEQNPGNSWQRRRRYLDTTIPSREALFQDFLRTRKWQKFKTDLINSNIDPTINGNPTRVEDVPIMCRILEAQEEDE